MAFWGLFTEALPFSVNDMRNIDFHPAAFAIFIILLVAVIYCAC